VDPLHNLAHHYDWKLVNGRNGDPALHVRSIRSGDGYLFDCGSLESLSQKDLLKIKVVFVSHTHVDHFIGFDRILRVNIPHYRNIHVVGPEGIIENVLGKIKGYRWNLLDPDQVQFTVHEYSSAKPKVVLLSNTYAFKPKEVDAEFLSKEGLEWQDSDALPYFRLKLPDQSHVQPIELDHSTISLGYKLSTPLRWQVQSEELKSLGIKGGPWIKELQHLLYRDQKLPSGNFMDAGHPAQLLVDRVMHSIPEASLGYLTDFAFAPSNIKRLSKEWQNIDQMICESSFADQDRERALKTAHLSSTQTALLAAMLRVKDLYSFHVSGIYGEEFNAVIEECLTAFSIFQKLPEDALQKAIEAELGRPSMSRPLVFS
jgi:ribonuclease Z